MAESQKVRMRLQDLKVKSFATTPSLKRDEGTVRGLDTCTVCTLVSDDTTCGLITTNDPTCGACTITTDDACNIQTDSTDTGGTGTGGGGPCGVVTEVCGTVTNGCTGCTGGPETCGWGAFSDI